MVRLTTPLNVDVWIAFRSATKLGPTRHPGGDMIGPHAVRSDRHATADVADVHVH